MVEILLDRNDQFTLELFGKGRTDNFVKPVNLKKFYTEFRDLLVELEFKDELGSKKEQDLGNFVGFWLNAGELESATNETRPADMFEKLYITKINESGFGEFELIWKAFLVSPYSKYGQFEFKLDIACRNLKDIEIGGKIFQSGKWEFRNVLIYRNKVACDFLKKIPIVKNSNFLIHSYMNFVYNKNIEADLDFGENVLIPKLHGFIKSYLT